jgi:hypothetical protein
MDYLFDPTLPPEVSSNGPFSEWDLAASNSASQMSSAVGRAITGWRALPGNTVQRVIADLILIQLLQKDAREFLLRSEGWRAGS